MTDTNDWVDEDTVPRLIFGSINNDLTIAIRDKAEANRLMLAQMKFTGQLLLDYAAAGDWGDDDYDAINSALYAAHEIFDAVDANGTRTEPILLDEYAGEGVCDELDEYALQLHPDRDDDEDDWDNVITMIWDDDGANDYDTIVADAFAALSFASIITQTGAGTWLASTPPRRDMDYEYARELTDPEGAELDAMLTNLATRLPNFSTSRQTSSQS